MQKKANWCEEIFGRIDFELQYLPSSKRLELTIHGLKRIDVVNSKSKKNKTRLYVKTQLMPTDGGIQYKTKTAT